MKGIILAGGSGGKQVISFPSSTSEAHKIIKYKQCTENMFLAVFFLLQKFIQLINEI